MTTMLRFLIAYLAFISAPAVPFLSADTLVFAGGRTVTGTILQTNAQSLLMITDFGTMSYALIIVKEIKVEKAEAVELTSTSRLLDERKSILLLSRQPWATELKQIPATVVDKGILKNVPYVSFRCGEDYEVNIYGDLDRPAAVEAGVYRKLLDDGTAKKRCVNFITELLGQAADKGVMGRLNLEKDLKSREGLTFEITPPTAEDAYMGWWISVYSEAQLNLARASTEEMKQISVPKNGAAASDEPSTWSADELKLARSSAPTTITFTDASGVETKDAQVVRVIDGVSLIWRKGASGGVVKLADLPEPLRLRFGYDKAKSESADAIEKAQRQAEALAAQSAQAAQNTQLHAGNSDTSYSAPSSVGGGGYSYSARSSGGGGGGSVFVRSYTRKDGTYVGSHTRSAPHSR